MTFPAPGRWSRRTFNRGLFWGGAGLLLPSACAHSPSVPAARDATGTGTRAPLPENGLMAGWDGKVLRLVYQFPAQQAERLEGSPVPMTFITAIEGRSQPPRCRALAEHTKSSLGPFLLREVWQWEAEVNVTGLLGLSESTGLWFIHAALWQYRSGVLALQLPD